MAAMAAMEPLMSRPDDEVQFAPKQPGSFQRGANNLQAWIRPGSQFEPAAGRYHIFVNYGCGWCHQCMLVLSVKGLRNVIGMSHTGLSTLGERGTDSYKGWSLAGDPTGNGFTCAFDVYNAARDYGRTQMTTPILFDKETKLVVSNDPAHMLLMFNTVFHDFAEIKIDLYPESLREQIEAVNAVVFPGINDGVYRCWFGKTDEAFDEGFSGVQHAFKWISDRLQSLPYLCGDGLTLADLRAYPHVFRFDVIYHKLMLKERGPYLRDAYPAVDAWLRRLFEDPRVQQVCDLQVATRFYMFDPDPVCDDQYARLKSSWMPSLDELRAKRQAEALPDLAAGNPHREPSAKPQGPGPNSS